MGGGKCPLLPLPVGTHGRALILLNYRVVVVIMLVMVMVMIGVLQHQYANVQCFKTAWKGWGLQAAVDMPPYVSVSAVLLLQSSAVSTVSHSTYVTVITH